MCTVRWSHLWLHSGCSVKPWHMWYNTINFWFKNSIQSSSSILLPSYRALVISVFHRKHKNNSQYNTVCFEDPYLQELVWLLHLRQWTHGVCSVFLLEKSWSHTLLYGLQKIRWGFLQILLSYLHWSANQFDLVQMPYCGFDESMNIHRGKVLQHQHTKKLHEHA